MAAALPLIFMAVSTIATMQAARNQAKATENAAQYNAAMDSRNATVSRQQAQADADRQQRMARQVTGRMIAGYGASGVTMEGSPMDVLESSVMNAERDRQTILYKGELRAMGYEDSANLATIGGENAESRGDAVAGSALLMGAGKVYSGGVGAGYWGGGAQTGYSLNSYGVGDYQ